MNHTNLTTTTTRVGGGSYAVGDAVGTAQRDEVSQQRRFEDHRHVALIAHALSAIQSLCLSRAAGFSRRPPAAETGRANRVQPELDELHQSAGPQSVSDSEIVVAAVLAEYGFERLL